jgi:hypothetical protein
MVNRFRNLIRLPLAWYVVVVPPWFVRSTAGT